MMEKSAPQMGLRERNKRSKEQRIREAARDLFVRNGYEETTLREVAALADVGFGTVSAYATDKAGLLAMVFVEQLAALPPLFKKGGNGDVLDELVSGLTHLYNFWGRTPSLSAQVLQQMEFFNRNSHLDLIVERRRRARAELATWLDDAQARKRISSDLNTAAAADTLFAIYTSAIREWCATNPGDVAGGISRLRELMQLAVRGLLLESANLIEDPVAAA